MTGRDLLEPDALRSFAAFAQHRSFTSAAAALNISQPALHVKIKKLAAALGTDLYERKGRSLVLTASGERLAAFALDARRGVDDFLDGMDEAVPALSIAAGRGTFRWVIGDAIKSVSQQGANIQLVTASRDAVIAALAAGRADIAVVAYDPPLARRDHLSLPDLAGLDLVVPPPGRSHRRALERALLDEGVPWQVAAEADGWDLLVHFASLGIGAAIVNGCVIPPAGLAAKPISGLTAVRYWATWRPQRQTRIKGLLSCLTTS